MGLNLRVAPRLEVLADALAAELSSPVEDPFLTEVLAVPGDGVRSWLMDQLSRRLGVDAHHNGAEPGGIAANIEVVFPATVVGRALSGDADLHPVMASWSVGPLTWAIHELLSVHGPALGIEGDLRRSRSVADQFDRYAMHRVEMVRAWESGRDVDPVGRQLPDGLRWQPQLWRALVQRLGPLSGPAAMAEATNRLRLGRITADLPSRVFLFGLASVPTPHLRVLAALATQIDVEMFVPTWSMRVWREIRDLIDGPRLMWPIERSADPSAQLTRHVVGAQWGRTSREAQLLLAAAIAEEPDAVIYEFDDELEDDAVDSDPAIERTHTLLARIQTDLRGDLALGENHSAPGIAPLVFDPTDRSVTWHRCHGPARQAEVLRDLVRSLLEERDDQGNPRFEPRDIAVLCADPSTSAPLISAAFSTDTGGEATGSTIPIRLADRSLREDSSLFGAISTLLDLCEGRFRANDLLGFATLEPVRSRFGWESADLGRIAGWIDDTGIRWGLEERHQTSFGLPAGLGVHTWRAGLDQLLLGAVMGDQHLLPQPSDSLLVDVAHPGIEGDLVTTVGGLAEMVHHLDRLDAAFAAVRTPDEWCRVLRGAVQDLCLLPEDQAWQWQRFDAQITAFLEEARVGGDPVSAKVTADELADLFRTRLVGSAGRVRFGTGAVTVSSLTAQRGVPHRVVVIHGLDGDLGAGSGRADDLIATQPCVGDRDPRAELRAQLLDAVLGATERLVIINTGRDITSNEEVPPAVPLAELADLIDATAIPAAPETAPVSSLITVEHPRHGWGEKNFQSGAMVPDHPWGFQIADLDAAVTRLGRRTAPPILSRWADLATEPTTVGPAVIKLADLERTLTNPLETYLAERLGLSLPRSSDEVDDLIPLSTPSLSGWRLRGMLLDERLRVGSQWSDDHLVRWSERQRRRGAVPPLLFGLSAIQEAGSVVDALISAAFPETEVQAEIEAKVEAGMGAGLDGPIEQRDVIVDLDGVQIHGSVGNIRGSRIVEIHPGTVRAEHLLHGWLRLMMLTCVEPHVDWELTLVGVDPNAKGKGRADAVSMTCRDLAAARQAVATVVELHRIALQSAVVAPASTTMAFATGGIKAAREAWEGFPARPGDRSNRWVRYAFGSLDFGDLVDIAPTSFEHGTGWALADSRVERWADRIWGSVTHSLLPPEVTEEAKEPWLMRWVRKIWSALSGSETSESDIQGDSDE
jgi:exodeoxyribonuclease V gamma subunit